jgi:hypothetical protein
MCSFYKYYAGEAIAPMLTIFIGGNHEASNYLQVHLSVYVDPDPALNLQTPGKQDHFNLNF